MPALAACSARLALACSLLAACGCARPEPASLPQLQLRAAFDLGCPPQQVQILHIDPRTKGVVGCGRRLTYVASCDERYERGSCTWVLDSPAAWPATSPLGPAPAATAPGPWQPVAPPPATPSPAAPSTAAPGLAAPSPSASAPPPSPAASAPATSPDFGF